MAKTPILVPLALSFIVVSFASLYGQEDGPRERINPYRLTRSRQMGTLSTHSQTEKSPRQLKYRGMQAAAAQQSRLRSSTLRQQGEYHRRVGTLPQESNRLDAQSRRARFAGQSNISATTNQRELRLLQASESGGWMGQRTQMRTSPELEALRNQLLARGVDPAMADQLTFHRGSVQSAAPAMQHASGPQLNQVRVDLQGSGVDPRQVNRDLVQAANSRAFNQRFENRTHANGAPNYEQLRSRVSQTGADPRSMNARLGRTLGTVGGSESAARYGSHRTRRR